MPLATQNTDPAPALPDRLAELRRRAWENPVIHGGLSCLPANPAPDDIVATLSAIICILDTERTALYARLVEAGMRQPLAPVTYAPAREGLVTHTASDSNRLGNVNQRLAAENVSLHAEVDALMRQLAICRAALRPEQLTADIVRSLNSA